MLIWMAAYLHIEPLATDVFLVCQIITTPSHPSEQLAGLYFCLLPPLPIPLNPCLTPNPFPETPVADRKMHLYLYLVSITLDI